MERLEAEDKSNSISQLLSQLGMQTPTYQGDDAEKEIPGHQREVRQVDTLIVRRQLEAHLNCSTDQETKCTIEPGPKGDPGLPGPQGETGAQGPKGDSGEEGEQGYPGFKGQEGVKGEVGEKGLQGLKGERGGKGDMGVCGGTSGWARVAYLDMTNSSHQCPGDMEEVTLSGKRLCGRSSNAYQSCVSANFSTNSL